MQSCRGLIPIVPGPAGVDECCGSIINFRNETSPTGSFQRISTGPAFYVAQGFPLARDISPPSRISDFTLVEQEDASLHLELSWTAPGGDYDFDRGEREDNRTLGRVGHGILCPVTSYTHYPTVNAAFRPASN